MSESPEAIRAQLNADLGEWAAESALSNGAANAAVWHREPLSHVRAHALRRLFAAGWLAWRRESAYDARHWIHHAEALNPKTGRKIGRKGLFLTTLALDSVDPDLLLTWSKGDSSSAAWCEWLRETAAPAPFLGVRTPTLDLASQRNWLKWEGLATCLTTKEWARVFRDLPSTLNPITTVCPPDTLTRVLRLAWLGRARRSDDAGWAALDERLAPWADAAVCQGADLGCQIPVGHGTLSAWGLLELLPLPKTRAALPLPPPAVWAERDPSGVCLAWRKDLCAPVPKSVLAAAQVPVEGWRFELGKALSACSPEWAKRLWEGAPYPDALKRACLQKVPNGGKEMGALHVLPHIEWGQRGAATATRACLDLIGLFTSWGVDPTAPDERGQTPLHALLQENPWQITGHDREGALTQAVVEDLTRRGTPLDMPDHNGQTVGALLKMWAGRPEGAWIGPWAARRSQSLLSEAVAVPEASGVRHRI